jgi:uncharacterized protein involved in cysteine biosynthesis
MENSKWGQLFFWVKGWQWLFEHPRSLGLVLAPFVLGLLLVGAGAWFLFPYVPGLSETLAGAVPGAAHFYIGSIVYWLVLLFLFVMFAGFGFIVLYCLYILLCAPFHAVLVERVLKTAGKHHLQELTFRKWSALTLKMFGVSLLKSLCFFALGGTAFVVSFIPGLQWVVFVTTAMIFAFDSMDYSFEALGFGLRRRFGYFLREKEQFFLFSMGMALTLFIPGLTFLALPGAVVGAALAIKQTQ